MTRSVRVGNGHGVELLDVVELKGYYAAWMRAALKEGKKVNRVQWFQQNVACYIPGLDVTDVAVEALLDNSKPLTLRVAFVQHHGLSDDGQEMRLSIPSVWTAFYFSFQNVPDRKNPFRINYPLLYESECTIESEIYQKAAGVLPAASGDHACFRWSLKNDGGFSCSVVPGAYDADQYQDFISEVHKGLKAAQWDVKLQKIPSVAAREDVSRVTM